MGVSRAEQQAMKLERQGETEEAAKFRARAEELRYEDPYTALQDQLDEAVKNEVGWWGRPAPACFCCCRDVCLISCRIVSCPVICFWCSHLHICAAF